MPKLSLPESTGVASVPLTRASIQNLTAQIEYLLEGRLDGYNIAENNGSYALISADTVQDIVSTVRPVGGNKLFGGDSTEGLFESMIENMKSNHEYVVLSNKKVITFLRDSTTSTRPTDIVMDIKKSPNLKLADLLRDANGMALGSDSPSFNVRVNYYLGGEDEDRWVSERLIVDESPENVSFVIPINYISDWDTGSSLDFTIEIFAVFERIL